MTACLIPALVSIAVLLLLTGIPGCRQAPQPKNVVLVVLDTVRADYTAVGRAQRDSTPFLERLAGGATRFTNCFTTAPWTVPSHASLFTGAVPSEHGCSMRNFRFESELPTLAEVLGEQGFRTAAIFANPWLTDDATGMLRGFEVKTEAPYSGFMNRPLGRRGYQGGQAVVAKVGEWLRDRTPGERFFLFVNFLEAHTPYDPPPDYRAEHLADLPRNAVVSIEWKDEFNAGLHPAESVDWDEVRRLYEGDVHTSDRLLAEVVQILEQQGVYDETILIVTSDHGESLGERGLIGHQFSIHESLLSVPLVIRAPGLEPGGVRENPVMITDVFATVLDLLGFDPSTAPPRSVSLLREPAGSEGSLRPVFAEYAGPHRSVLSLMQNINPDLDADRLSTAYTTVRIGDLRLTLGSDGSVALYDMAADPGETRNIAEERPDEVATLRAALEQALSLDHAAPAEEIELDEATKERLRSLGYIQ